MILKLCGVAIISSILVTVLKKTGDGTLPLSIIAVVTVLLLSAEPLSDVASTVTDTLSPVGFGTYGAVMVKALGIALTVKITSDICRQCGEEALSGGIEFAGKIQMLCLSLPLMSAMLDAVRELIS